MASCVVIASLRTRCAGQYLGMFLGKHDGGFSLLCQSLEDGARLGSRFPNDDGYSFLDNTTFLHRYLLERRAQQVRMVKADVGDERDDGRDDVRAVETSAQSHFYDCDVDILLSEILKRHRRGNLEKRGSDGLEKLQSLFHEIDDIALRDGLTVHPDALAEIDQMR